MDKMYMLIFVSADLNKQRSKMLEVA